MKSDVCDGCGAVRKSSERWFFVYPDIMPAKTFVPLSRWCKSCSKVLGLVRRTARRKAGS